MFLKFWALEAALILHQTENTPQFWDAGDWTPSLVGFSSTTFCDLEDKNRVVIWFISSLEVLTNASVWLVIPSVCFYMLASLNPKGSMNPHWDQPFLSCYFLFVNSTSLSLLDFITYEKFYTGHMSYLSYLLPPGKLRSTSARYLSKI